MSPNPPRVSVVMPVYNGGGYLARAIQSVLRQSLTEVELVVVDDGSTDGSDRVVESVRDPRVRLIRSGRNEGIARALARGMAEARAPVIARLDADDLAMPTRLERQLAFLDAHPSVALVGCWAALIDESDREFMRMRFPVTPPEIYAALLEQNCLNHSSVTFRKAAVEEVGGYRRCAGGAAVEDYDLWLRLAERFDLANLPEVLTAYRVHSSQVTQRRYALQREAGNALRHAAALERQRLGRLADAAPYAPPGVLDRLRGSPDTPGSDCIGWSTVYRHMGRPRAAIGFAVRGCLRSPLRVDAWRALILAVAWGALPVRTRRRVEWYATRLRPRLTAQPQAQQTGDRSTI